MGLQIKRLRRSLFQTCVVQRRAKHVDDDRLRQFAAGDPNRDAEQRTTKAGFIQTAPLRDHHRFD